MLELRDVAKSYPGAEGAPPVEVLRGVNLSVAAGETLAIVGASGSGKSTLLNLMGALDEPTAGVVTLSGVALAGLSENRLAALRAQELGFVFQLHHLLPQCTVWENVLAPTLAGPAPHRTETAAARAERLLQRVGLAHRRSHRPAQLSGGERQRAAVVRALINAPRVLLADEPTGSLDRASAESLTELLLELNREEGVALVVVTHSQEVARRMGRVLELRDGGLYPLETGE